MRSQKIKRSCISNKIGYVFIFLLSISFLSGYDAFTGYKKWLTAKPAVYIKINPQEKVTRNIVLELKCNGAQEFKISNDPSFSNAVWRKYKREIEWRIGESSDIVTVFAVFKKKDKGELISKVSGVVSYTIDKNHLDHEIEHYGNGGYINWSTGEVFINVRKLYPLKQGERYNVDKAQQSAEIAMYKNCYDILKNVRINYFFKVRDILKLDSTLYDEINRYILNLKIFNIKYLSHDYVELNAVLPFSVADNNAGPRNISFLAQPLLEEPDPLKDMLEKKYHALILDVRGFNFKPCLFPSVASESGEMLVSVSRFHDKSKVFVKYVRDITENLTGQYSNILFIKAVNLDSHDKSQIIVTERYKELIMANRETINHICNGHFYVFTK